jgi:hypothetical protein
LTGAKPLIVSSKSKYLTMTSDLAPGYILPNISVLDPIENKHYALISCNDDRALALRQAHPQFDIFINHFFNEFGDQVAPAILMVREGNPALVGIEQASGFRDAIALSFVCKARALRLIYPMSRPLQFSSWFDFHPWIISTDFAGIVGNSPAFNAQNDAKNFHGHANAGLPHAQLRMTDCDTVLMDALLGAWKRRFISHQTSWRSVALFRSLNMAYAASQLPSGPDMTHYALGRAVGLWISAFEILTHPGKDGQVGHKNIYKLLHQVPWRDQELTKPIYDAYAGKDRTALNTLPCWIYGELFRARNDFLHGEPVALDRLVVASSGQTLYNFAALLYRACLTAFLGLGAYGPSPDTNDGAAHFLSWRMHINQYQSYTERALLRVFKAPV